VISEIPMVSAGSTERQIIEYINGKLLPIIAQISGELNILEAAPDASVATEESRLADEIEDLYQVLGELESIIEKQNQHIEILQEENKAMRSGEEVGQHVFGSRS